MKKQLVLNHRNSFSYKFLVVLICEGGPDYSLVMWLENAGAIWGKETQLSHSLGNLCDGDEHHTGQ
jgi:hypothetical protein